MSRAHFAALWAGVLIFIACVYFQNRNAGWNVNSQFALSCALAERGTFQIDHYLDKPEFETGDYAIFEGHKYSDKAVVTPLLGAPVVWLCRQWCQARGVPMDYTLARRMATVLVIGGSAALFAGVLVLVLLRHGLSPFAAFSISTLYMLSTPLFGYAILFFNNMPACTLALLGWWLAEPFWLGTGPYGRPRSRAFCAGLALGLATWTLNTQAIPAVVITVLYGWGLWRWGSFQRGKAARLFLNWTAGGLVGVAGHFIATYAVFHTLSSPYVYEADPVFRESMARGLMGATRPSALVAWLITFHPFHGLFLWFPLTLLGLLGCLQMLLREPRARAFALAAVVIFALLLLYNSAYFLWWGGWTYAPRFLIPALPFLALGLIPWLKAQGRWAHFIFGVVAVCATILNLSLVTLDPQFPPGVEMEAVHPENVAHWPTPQLNQLRYVWVGWQSSPNLGTRMGLRGGASLLPLGLILGLGYLILWRRTRERDATGPGN